MHFSRVDLPAPLRPTRPTLRPGSTTRSADSSRARPAMRSVRSRMVRTVIAGLSYRVAAAFATAAWAGQALAGRGCSRGLVIRLAIRRGGLAAPLVLDHALLAADQVDIRLARRAGDVALLRRQVARGRARGKV